MHTKKQMIFSILCKTSACQFACKVILWPACKVNLSHISCITRGFVVAISNFIGRGNLLGLHSACACKQLA